MDRNEQREGGGSPSFGHGGSQSYNSAADRREQGNSEGAGNGLSGGNTSSGQDYPAIAVCAAKILTKFGPLTCGVLVFIGLMSNYPPFNIAHGELSAARQGNPDQSISERLHQVQVETIRKNDSIITAFFHKSSAFNW